MDRMKLLSALIPRRDDASNKGTYGTLTVIGGSDKYRGAPILASEAALRCGVGICRLCSIEKVIASAVTRCPELVCLPVDEAESGAISSSAFSSEFKNIIKSMAILIGIGMTDSSDTASILGIILNNYSGSLVIDADGLNCIKHSPEKLLMAQNVPVITPHIGEMSRHTGMTVSEIKRNREAVALDFSAKYNCVIVLKDSITVIASPDGRSYICENENSALSKGGSGDVLAGMIASLLAQSLLPYEAALCGVIIHSEAGRSVLKKMASEYVLPSDIIAAINDVYIKVKETAL